MNFMSPLSAPGYRGRAYKVPVFGKAPVREILPELRDRGTALIVGRRILKLAAEQNQQIYATLVSIEFTDDAGAGDEALLSVSETLSGQFGDDALVTRYGETGFAVMVVAPDDAPTMAAAHCRLDTLRMAIREKLAATERPYTISIGAAVGRSGTPEGMLSKADELLRIARAAGNDCTAIAPVREPMRWLTRPRRH
jgi:hypothetical protein